MWILTSVTKLMPTPSGLVLEICKVKIPKHIYPSLVVYMPKLAKTSGCHKISKVKVISPKSNIKGKNNIPMHVVSLHTKTDQCSINTSYKAGVTILFRISKFKVIAPRSIVTWTNWHVHACLTLNGNPHIKLSIAA